MPKLDPETRNKPGKGVVARSEQRKQPLSLSA